MLEHPVDIGADRNRLCGIAEQIADHAHAAGMRQLDEHGDVGTVPLQCGVRWMPRPLPTEDPAMRLDLGPFRIEGVAMMADPFRTELPGVAMAAALHQKPALAQSFPIRRGKRP